MVVKLAYINKQMFFETTLNSNELIDFEYELNETLFSKIEELIKNEHFYIINKDIQDYDYIISLIPKEYEYLANEASSTKDAMEYLEKKEIHEKERTDIANAILRMFETAISTKPILIGEFVISPWECEDIDWVDGTVENIILFYSKQHNCTAFLL
jgi:hypothetical protein